MLLSASVVSSVELW